MTNDERASHCLRIANRTRNVELASCAEVADNPLRRLKGLLGRARLEPGQALVLRNCLGVHTWFMSFPIDVLHLDAEGVVCRVVSEMAPNRFGPLIWPTRYVVELPAGGARASGTQVGDVVRLGQIGD